MRTSSSLFTLGLIFFIPVAAIYAYFSNFEPVGSVGMLLLGIMSGMVGLYLRATLRKLDESPSDNPDGTIAQGAGEYGFFAPYSWWPLFLGVSAMLVFLGLAVGWWVFVIGVVCAVLSLIGWTFEYFRGDVI